MKEKEMSDQTKGMTVLAILIVMFMARGLIVFLIMTVIGIVFSGSILLGILTYTGHIEWKKRIGDD